MDDDNFDEVHLIKLKLPKPNSVLRISCPYHQKFVPTVQLKSKTVLYVPLINKLFMSQVILSNQKKFEIPIDVNPLLQHPFDKHHLKIQTYEDESHSKKGEVVSLYLQFSLFLTTKGQINYVEVQFRRANLKKDTKLFSKMSPYIEVSNDKWKGKTHPVKDGHLNPKFMENLSIPFNSVFDRVIIEIKDGESKIGYEALYIFQLFGKGQQREIEIKKQFKQVGTLVFVVSDFDPQDF